ncbi:MAG: M23 family metallopeptidase [Gemmatimonadales bacterium]|nr:MAG: M23 family metallopeptidase [Gemmatimonadales bacterium]
MPDRGSPNRTWVPRSGTAAGLLVAVLASGCTLPRWPVEGPVTSAFGVRWRGTLPEIHRGVDIGVPSGTEVRAMSGARVRFAGVQGDYGNVVWLDHGGRVLTVYAHLSEVRVATGEAVRSGQVIGLSGASGNAGGPHLHFEVWRWGTQTDPAPLLGGSPGGG